ncbi:MAG TPA: hypothetical protein VLT79_06525 [Gemmatimonadales bacterium]|nr:hypothetical protein [Gemmatimonadales bacterium]
MAAAIIGCGGGQSPTQPAQPAAVTKLVFTVQPTNGAGAQPIAPAVQVAIQDASGNAVTTASDSVTLALAANPGAGALSGALTVAATQGVATFTNLRVDRPGSGYTLAASAAGRTGATSAPFNVKLTFTAVSAGFAHTCGLTIGGHVYCWGYRGRVGSGTASDQPSPVLVATPPSVTFVAVSAGLYHACAVTTAGAAYCWGDNGDGQLGDGTTIDRSTPVLVTGGVSFAAVSAGNTHTCAVTAAGAAYCWGGNQYGELGDGTTTGRLLPVPVAAPTGVSFTAVSAGGQTCALTAAGAAYCWGYNVDGGLGDGTTTNRSSPVPVAGGVTLTKVNAGSGHACGVDAAGAGYCWGRNDYGQVGDGTTTTRVTPTALGGTVTFVSVSPGNDHTCAVTASGASYCWGFNLFGQLGDGTTTDESSRVAVAAPAGVSLAAVTAGNEHSCGVTAAGAAYCWGLNHLGQLGDGTMTQSLTPVRVVQ